MLALLMILALMPSAAVAQDDEEVVVRIGLHAAEKNLNPFISPTALPITHDFTMLVYDTLFWSQATLDPEPWLATGAEPSDDFRTWTVSLREGVTWHDGMPFTAEDVAFTYQYFTDVGGPGRYGHHVTDHPKFASANVIDDLTVELSFVDPVSTFMMLPGGDVPIVAKHIWEGVEDPLADATSLQIGTGPYRMVDYDPNTSYRLEANEDYFKGKPLVDTLIMPVIRDAQAAFAGLQTGELDFVTRNVPAPLIAQIEANDELALAEGSRMQSMYLMFNTRKPALRDPLVRKAMSMALDVQMIVDIVEGGLGVPGNDTWTHPESEFAHPTGGHEFDVDAANAMLDDAGYSAGDGGTRVSADGVPLEFTLLVNATAPPQIRAGELVAEQLELLGVDITVEPLDPPAIGAMRRPSPDGPPTNDMFIAVFESHAHADPEHLYFFFHTPGSGGVGVVFSGYSNPEFDALLEEGLSATIEDKAALIEQAQDIFAEEQPAVTLYYPNGRWAYRPAAFDGWASDPGHGVFTKRSLLPTAAEPEPEPEPTEVPEPAAAEEPEDEAEAEEPAAEPTEAPEVEPEPADDAEQETDADDEQESASAGAVESDSDSGGGLSGLAVGGIVVAAAAVLGGGAMAARSRRREGTVED